MSTSSSSGQLVCKTILNIPCPEAQQVGHFEQCQELTWSEINYRGGGHWRRHWDRRAHCGLLPWWRSYTCDEALSVWQVLFHNQHLCHAQGTHSFRFFLEKVVLLVNIFESIVCLASLEMSINVQNTSINGLKRKISIFGVSPLPWKSWCWSKCVSILL